MLVTVKWLGPGAITPLAIDGSLPKSELHTAIRQWTVATGRSVTQPVIIVSYESLRLLIEQLGDTQVGLLLADEAHRLKNAQNNTYTALNSINVQRRVLLTGTPVQNDLTEYFSLLNFANPGILGTRLEFRKNFENAILKGRDADATPVQQAKCEEKLKELIALVSKFLIRRTNDLLTKYCKSFPLLAVGVRLMNRSTGQIRTCRLLRSFTIPTRPLSSRYSITRSKRSNQRIRQEPFGRYWHVSEAVCAS